LLHFYELSGKLVTNEDTLGLIGSTIHYPTSHYDFTFQKLGALLIAMQKIGGFETETPTKFGTSIRKFWYSEQTFYAS